MLSNKRIESFFNKRYFLKVWFFFFFVTLFVILFVQFIVLPYIFPAWHAGDGLLIGGDWLAFQRTAVSMANRIQEEGWSAWELRPRGWMPAGLAGALYALTLPKPWVLAPLNAAVHATTALFVIKLILVFYDNRRAAFFASLPFAFFPSAMLWYTQIHRDGYNILGMVLFLYGFFLIFNLGKEREESKLLKTEVVGFFTMLTGVLLIWLVRPHALEIFYYVGLFLFLLSVAVLFYYAVKKMVSWKSFFSKLVFWSLVFVIISFLMSGEGSSKYMLEAAPQDREQELSSNIGNDGEDVNSHAWVKTGWLPRIIDNQLYSMAVLRSVTFPERYGDTVSGIDYDVSFHRATDFILYLPRALQISFLAPFPPAWFGEGSLETTTFFRRVSAFEMLFIYLAYIGLLYGIWIWRKKIELYFIIGFCIVMILPIVYSVPNIGTIYRYRYGFLMIMVSLGVAAILHYRNALKARSEEVDQAGADKGWV